MAERPRAGKAVVAPEEHDIARALSFVNTLSGRTTAAPAEKLTSFETLLEWARESGLLKADEVTRLAARARRRTEEAERVLTRARETRELLNATLVATSQGRTPSGATLDALSEQLAGWYAHGRLVPCGDAMQWIYAGDDDLERALWEVARIVSRLLMSPRLAKVRACAAEDCGWWFLDDTKNASKRWCDMKICGNREKLRRFREKHTHKESR